MFSAEDLKQIELQGLSLSNVKKQILRFESGFPSMVLKSSANLTSGIISLKDTDLDKYENIYNNEIKNISTIKFVPASGAATRMFKELFDYRSDKTDTKSIKHFFSNLHKFAFFDDLKEKISEYNYDIDDLLERKEYKLILEFILDKKGLNYSLLPKGMIKFHKYENEIRTSFEEHLIEAVNYSKNENSVSKVHFTVSDEHLVLFREKLDLVKDKIEDKYNTKFEINFSTQKTNTNTIAVDMHNKAFRESDNNILFRPAGHGALIENMNNLEEDIVFVKNIDNVVPDKLKQTTFRYKKVLAGKLIETQKQIFEFINTIKKNKLSQNQITNMLEYTHNNLNIISPKKTYKQNITEQTQYLLNVLNRPIRVCGMVKNEGEPGGGPFLTLNKDESISLQIVESAQINKTDKSQLDILKSSTHFNPVDLVCGLRNYKGEKFNLNDFVDDNTGFISTKSMQGRNLKAMELPGLWNGAMSKWNTIFIEVPAITFNPVKTVSDLLRAEHCN